ncbi:MAG: acetoacetate decarboxylase family protein, partial [Deltaproteobacteria bacterium]
PILYRDVSNVIALFLARREGVRDVLRATGLVPAVVVGDRALVGVSFYEYRNTTVGVYNEVGTAIFALREGERAPRLGLADMYVPPRWRTVGAWVVDLPVTTAAANAAGRELWGYPKFVTAIPFRMRGRDVETSVLDPETRAPIVTLAGRMGPGLPAPPLGLMTYSRLDGALVRTHIDVRGWVTAHPAGTVRLSVGPSTHGMAERLRALGLVDARPVLLLRTDRFQSKLHAGTRVL